MKQTYPYSKELKKPAVYAGVDYEQIVLNGKMKSTADFLQMLVRRYKSRHSELEKKQYTSFDGEQITCYVFSPEKDKTAGSLLPAIIYYHGGGFMFPLQKFMMANSDLMAEHTGVRVFLPDYRTSLTHSCDTVIEDCYEMLRYVFRNASALGVDPDRILLYGDSAGGALAACTAILNRDRDAFPIRGQLLIYPVCDNESWKYSSVEEYPDAPWSKKANEQMWRLYLMRGCSDIKKVIPMKNQLHDLPPAYIEPLEVDVLRDEAAAYGRKLKKAGVSVSGSLVKGAYHGYDADLKNPLVRKSLERRYDAIRNFVL